MRVIDPPQRTTGWKCGGLGSMGLENEEAATMEAGSSRVEIVKCWRQLFPSTFFEAKAFVLDTRAS